MNRKRLKNYLLTLATLALVEVESALTEAFVTEFVFTTIAIFDAVLALMTVLTFASVFELASATGAVSAGVSVIVCKTEMFPVKAGIARKSADSIKTVAATIVIFDKIVCEPRGWKAVLEILLVKSAPASVFPGCSKTLAINRMQDIKNNVYKM